VCDRPVTQEFKPLLKTRSVIYDEVRVIDEPVASVEQLLSQLAATDVVVATLFHNALLALMLDKPAFSISFHQKCVSLMDSMGLSLYSLDFNHFDSAGLIQRFSDLEKNAEKLRVMVRQKIKGFRMALDVQYASIFADFFPDDPSDSRELYERRQVA
jgi:polysaccharide pyruvyl transferase WcaK-like protein